MRIGFAIVLLACVGCSEPKFRDGNLVQHVQSGRQGRIMLRVNIEVLPDEYKVAWDDAPGDYGLVSEPLLEKVPTYQEPREVLVIPPRSGTAIDYGPGRRPCSPNPCGIVRIEAD